MSRKNVFNLRLSDEELAKLQAYAQVKQTSAAEVLRNYIKRLRISKNPFDLIESYAEVSPVDLLLWRKLYANDQQKIEIDQYLNDL